jgi:hypothetical protein
VTKTHRTRPVLLSVDNPNTWERDAVDGGSSSMEIVLDWLTTGSNYQRWRGNLEEGKTKKSLCAKIIEIMKNNGINHRDAKGKFIKPKEILITAYSNLIIPPRHNPKDK